MQLFHELGWEWTIGCDVIDVFFQMIWLDCCFGSLVYRLLCYAGCGRGWSGIFWWKIQFDCRAKLKSNNCAFMFIMGFNESWCCYAMNSFKKKHSPTNHSRHYHDHAFYVRRSCLIKTWNGSNLALDLSTFSEGIIPSISLSTMKLHNIQVIWTTFRNTSSKRL